MSANSMPAMIARSSPQASSFVWSVPIGAVANETMRLRPVAPLLILEAIGDTTLGDMIEDTSATSPADAAVLQEAFGDKYRPCPLLFKYVEAGYLGVKTGRGFYSY